MTLDDLGRTGRTAGPSLRPSAHPAHPLVAPDGPSPSYLGRTGRTAGPSLRPSAHPAHPLVAPDGPSPSYLGRTGRTAGPSLRPSAHHRSIVRAPDGPTIAGVPRTHRRPVATPIGSSSFDRSRRTITVVTSDAPGRTADAGRPVVTPIRSSHQTDHHRRVVPRTHRGAIAGPSLRPSAHHRSIVRAPQRTIRSSSFAHRTDHHRRTSDTPGSTQARRYAHRPSQARR